MELSVVVGIIWYSFGLIKKLLFDDFLLVI